VFLYVGGLAPLLGCRPIRVRVLSLYMYHISYAIQIELHQRSTLSAYIFVLDKKDKGNIPRCILFVDSIVLVNKS
jgi:hypothetical protein